VPYNHLGIGKAVPKKCSECQHLFEGSCRRNFEESRSYLHLDYGYCGINGPTDPVIYEDPFITSKVEIPRKCANCHFLVFHKTYGFRCRKDADIWGDCQRGLDWGSWEPDSVYLQLPLPKVTSRKLSLFARSDDLVSFIQEYRRINPGLSIQEAQTDFAEFRAAIALDYPAR
jgi:hypothetical protein